MSDNNEDTSYQDQFHVDFQDETVDTETTGGKTAQDKEDKYALLQAQIAAQNEQILLLKSQQSMPATPVAPKQATPEMDAAMLEQLGKNPAALVSFVNQKIDAGMNSIQKQNLKQHLDAKVYEEFPALKTNAQFTEAVKTQMRELVTNQEYDAQHPMLVYRAAQLAAAKVPTTSSQVTRQRDTSVAPSGQRGTHRSSAGTIKNNDPRLAFAVAARLTDPKKLAEFKKNLETYGSTDEHMQKRGQLKPKGRMIGGR